MTFSKFNTFFKDYSVNVDQFDNQYFWKLSDKIIETIIRNVIGFRINENSTILDAGGWTGRWIVKLSKKYKCNFVLYDLSDPMLIVANKKKELQKLGDKFMSINGNLENMSKVKSDSIDYIISIYNPLSFVDYPSKVFSEFNRILKKDGVAMVMGQGYYNALYSKINNYIADSKELNELYKNTEVAWNKNIPKLKVFTKESLEKFVVKSGLTPIKSYGIPVFIQPQSEDFGSIIESKGSLSSKLEKDPKFFKTVYDIEMAFNSQESVVNRGMNIMIVAKKQ